MKICLLAFLMFTASVFAANNPIDNLADELSKNPSWQDGRVPVLNLPATARNTEVLGACLKANGFDAAAVASAEINEVKEIHLPTGVFLVASCKTNSGRKLLVFNYGATGWWARIYDEKEYQPK